jgi:homoserine O-acetyltransferase
MNTKTLHFGASQREVEVGQVTNLFEGSQLELACGAKISNFPVAYQTYGTLNADASNAILICHALTGDQYVASPNPVTGKNGWWSGYVGEGKPIDTSKFFVICPNVLGGCLGTYGPKDINPATSKPFGLDFPIITVADMVAVQKALIEKLGVKKLYAVICGSMGGMQTLEWISKYPDYINSAVVIAASYKHSAQNIAFNEIGRQAIMADVNYASGKYFEEHKYPSKGLAIARMMAHITYLSEYELQKKFGRKLQNKAAISYGFDADFQVESYLRHQGMSFVERFDPNCYLYITRAMDYFDLEDEFNGNLANAFTKAQIPVCVVSFTSDWLFTPDDAKDIVRALSACGSEVSFLNIESDKGHDSFLLPSPIFEAALKGFIENR